MARRLDGDLPDGAATAALRRERARLERAIRARVLRTPGSEVGLGRHPPVKDLLDALDGAALVSVINVDGVLHAVTLARRRARLHAVGPMSDAVREVDFARFLLNRMSRRPPSRADAAMMDRSGRLLESALLGPAVADLPRDARVVVVPPGRLHALPWALLPSPGSGRSA